MIRLFTKKKPMVGFQGIMDPTVFAIEKLHQLGGLGYVLFGSGFIILLVIISFVGDIVNVLFDKLLILSFILLAAGCLLVVIWKLLEYRVSVIKLQLICSITEKMIEKKLKSQETLDTSEMRTMLSDIIRDVWGLEIHLLPSSEKKEI